MLHEVHLVDVAARDRRAHLLDRGRVRVVVPAALPLAQQVTTCYKRCLGSRPDAAREERQRALLGRGGPGKAAKRVGEPVAEIEVGDDAVAAPEALRLEELLERLERTIGGEELERQRRRPRVSR
jgi:hypothetical protein